MKNNMLVPVEKDVPPVRCGLFRMTIQTMLEDPRASLFVEAIPLCIQLNLTVLMRLFFIHKVYIETPTVLLILLDLLLTTLIYSISVTAKLRFLLPTKWQRGGVFAILCGGFFTQMALVLFAEKVQSNIVDEFLAAALSMLLYYLAVGAMSMLFQLLWENPDSILHRIVAENARQK